jgi:ankyrin repeat protein
MTASRKKREPKPQAEIDNFVLAAGKGEMEAVKAFLHNYGSRYVNEKASGSGNRALHLAAYFNHLAVVRQLIDAGADVNALDGYRSTPLMVVAVPGHLDIIRELVASGADVAKKHGYVRKTARWYAEANEHPEAVALIDDAPHLRAEKLTHVAEEAATSLMAGIDRPITIRKPLKLSM